MTFRNLLLFSGAKMLKIIQRLLLKTEDLHKTLRAQGGLAISPLESP
jgi:hypothetical protein